MLRSGAARRKVQRELRPSEPPRCLVPPRRGRRQPHAHRRHRDLRRPRAPLLRRRRHGPGQAPPRPALPAGGPLRPAGPGTAGVGRRPAFQHRLPPSPHRAPRAGRRGRAAGLGGASHGPAARPVQAAVGDLDGRGPRARAVGAAVEDPPRPRRRGGGHRPAGGDDGHDSPQPTPPVDDDWRPRPAPSGTSLAIGAATDLVRSPYEQLRALRASTRVPRARPVTGRARWPAACRRWPA